MQNTNPLPLGTPVLILPDDHTQTEARGVVTGHHGDWLFVKTDDDEELVHSDLVVPLAFEIGPMVGSEIAIFLAISAVIAFRGRS